MNCVARCFSRPIAAAAAVLVATVILGCLSFTYSPGLSDAMQQEGSACVPAHGEVEVFYPIPYASPPNLTLEESYWRSSTPCILAEQKDNHFRVRNDTNDIQNINWKARGVRLQPVVPVVPEGPPPPPEAPPGAKTGPPP